MHQQIRQILFQRLVVQPSVTIPPVLRYLEVAAFVVGCTDTLCTVVRLILAVAEGERPCGEFVLVCGCFTPDDTAPKVGMLSGVNVKATASCKESGLLSCTAVVGVDAALVPVPVGGWFGEVFGRGMDAKRESKPRRFILLLVGFLFLQCFYTKMPADLCGDLIALCLAPDDVHILARGEAELVLCDNEGRGVGSNGLFAVAVAFVCTDADVRESLWGKGCPDTCGAEFVLGCCNACILACCKTHAALGSKRYVTACNG